MRLQRRTPIECRCERAKDRSHPFSGSAATDLLAPDSRVLAAVFFLVAAFVASFVSTTNVYLIVAIAGLLWKGVRLWALAAEMKRAFVALGLEGADVKIVVHAMMIAETVGAMAQGKPSGHDSPG